MATPKNVWNNSAEMHEIISKEAPEYFEAPEPKKVTTGGSTYYEMPPSQFAIDAILNEARINRLNGGSNNVRF